MINISSYDERDQHAMEQIAWQLAEFAASDLVYIQYDPYERLRELRPAASYEVRMAIPNGNTLAYRFSPNDDEFAYIQERAKDILIDKILQEPTEDHPLGDSWDILYNRRMPCCKRHGLKCRVGYAAYLRVAW